MDGEQEGLLEVVIQNCDDRLGQDDSRGKQGLCRVIFPNSQLSNNLNCMLLAVAFQFCRVGDDESARAILRKLGDSDHIGGVVSCIDSELTENASGVTVDSIADSHGIVDYCFQLLSDKEQMYKWLIVCNPYSA